MGKLTVTVRKPSSASTTVPVPIFDLSFGGDVGYAETCTFTILSHFDLFSNEGDTNNPLRRRASIVVAEDGVTIWRGKVESLAPTKSRGGARAIIVTAHCKLADHNRTIATYNSGAGSSTTFTVETPELAVTTATLYPIPAVGGSRYPYVPDPASVAWLGTSYIPSTHLGETCTSAPSPADGATIKLDRSGDGLVSNEWPAAAMRGIAKINSEYIAYDGIYMHSNGFWYLHNIDRAVLGSSAGNHSIGDTVYFWTLKRIHFRRPIKVEGQRSNDSAWEIVHDKYYTVQIEDGRIDFDDDLTSGNLFFLDGSLTKKYNNGAAGDRYYYTALRATYAVYDETGAGVVYLGEFFGDMLSDTHALGNKADSGTYSGGSYQSDDLDIQINVTGATAYDVAVSRIAVDEPTHTGELIRSLNNDFGLVKGSTFDSLMYYYDHSAGKTCLKSIVQKTTPDYIFGGETEITREYNTDNLYSATLVKYSNARDTNLLGATRQWHIAHDSGAPLTKVIWLDKTNSGWYDSLDTDISVPSATNRFGPLILDNDLSTGGGIKWGTGGTTTTPLYAWVGWFPPATGSSNPATYRVQKITAVFDIVDDTGLPASVYMHIVGHTSYTAGSGAPGSHTYISRNLTVALNDGIHNYPSYKVEADNLGIDLQAISLYVESTILSTSGTYYEVRIKEILVEGEYVGTAECRLTATAPTTETSGQLYAPNSYGALVDVNDNNHQTYILDVGDAGENVAQNLATLQEIQNLIMSDTRVYVMEGFLPGIPDYGDTVQFSDDFIGVVNYRFYEAMSGGKRRLTLRVTNYDTTLFGNGV